MYRTEIVADTVQFGAKNDTETERKANLQAEIDKRVPATKAPEFPEEEINPDDIPF